MKTLAVWTFSTHDAADAAVERLRPLAAGHRVSIDDAAAVSWPSARRRPELLELGCLTGPGALWRGFWGLLLGLIFLSPLAGLTFGAGAGAVAGSLADIGIDGTFIKHVRREVTAGTSAVLLLAEGPAVDRIAEALHDFDKRLRRANLDSEQQRRLRDAFIEV
jgi:uncharacterized membrane protein